MLFLVFWRQNKILLISSIYIKLDFKWDRAEHLWLELEFSGYFLPKDGKNIKDCMSISYKFPKFVFIVSAMKKLNFSKKNNSSKSQKILTWINLSPLRLIML